MSLWDALNPNKRTGGCAGRYQGRVTWPLFLAPALYLLSFPSGADCDLAESCFLGLIFNVPLLLE